jgi:hypothetical protein
MESIQDALTYAIEAITVVGISGIVAHALFAAHCQWKNTYCPPVAPFQEGASCATPQSAQETQALVEAELIPAAEKISQAAKKLVTESIPATDTALNCLKQVAKSSKTCAKKEPNKLQPISVGAAAVDYAAMTSEQLRKECALQGLNWRSGGDYGKPMKKAQMLAALS